ncbi:hypothetical protein OIDMADRAFT_91534, partial [Oidiodendron maius Zn]
CPPQPASPAMQKAIFTDFLYIFYNERNVSKAFNTYVAEDYIQHDPRYLDGRDAAIAGLTPLIASGVPTVEQLIFDGNRAVVYEKAPGTVLTAIVDIFRLNGTCIQEHWNVHESLPSDAVSSHPFF